jgi:Flp pilus assembly protein TadG
MAVMSRMLRRWRSESGAELIELALVLPILLLLCAAIIDFGFLFRSWETAVNAAREGARVGSLPNYADADVYARVNLYMQAAGIDPGAYVSNVQPTSLAVGPGSVQARAVSVTVTHQFIIFDPISAFFGGGIGSVDVTGVAEMRLEQQAVAGP